MKVKLTEAILNKMVKECVHKILKEVDYTPGIASDETAVANNSTIANDFLKRGRSGLINFCSDIIRINNGQVKLRNAQDGRPIKAFIGVNRGAQMFVQSLVPECQQCLSQIRSTKEAASIQRWGRYLIKIAQNVLDAFASTDTRRYPILDEYKTMISQDLRVLSSTVSIQTKKQGRMLQRGNNADQMTTDTSAPLRTAREQQLKQQRLQQLQGERQAAQQRRAQAQANSGTTPNGQRYQDIPNPNAR